MKLPFTLTLTLFYSLLFPGFLMALGFLPILISTRHFISIEYSFTLLTILMGWFIIISDMFIYMVFEGRRYWPKIIKQYLLALEAERLVRLRKIIESKDLDKSKYIEANNEIKKFPIEEGEYTVKYPTRIGNLIAEYEGYPSRNYGMDPIFYWPRIWLTLNKDVREELSSQQALADSGLYSTAALYSSSLLYLIYASLKLLKIPCTIKMPEAYILLFIALLGILIGRIIYIVSIHIQSQFGDTFKSVFDLNRYEIPFPEVLNNISDIIDVPNLYKIKQKDQYKYIWRYLQYNLIKVGEAPALTPKQIDIIKRKKSQRSNI
jgi:hypothetical protein